MASHTNSPSNTSKASDGTKQVPLRRDDILQEILDNIDNYKRKQENVNLSELKDKVIRPALLHDFDPEVQIRGFLRTFQHTLIFRASLDKIGSRQLKDQIKAFVNGKSAKEVVQGKGFAVSAHPSPGVKQHFYLLGELKKLVLKGYGLTAAFNSCFGGRKKQHVRNLPLVYEDAANTKLMEVYSDVPFSNWGEAVKNTPRYTFLPTTVLGVQNLVRYASSNNLRVRCGGYRHSWSSIFSQDNEIFVSFVNLEEVTTVPDPMSILPGAFTGQPGSVSELKTIELKEQLADKKRLCRIGVAVTNEDFRRWAVANNAWALPVDVLLVEVTIGGVNGPICHGAGRRHKTVSDLVRRVEYVDCRGIHQTVDDPELVKAAAGSFGLLGVVTHLTFELDAMTYAVMEPRKVDIGLAIPPPSKQDIPVALRADWFDAPDAEERLLAAKEEFERRAADDYYSEWFWFTYQQKAWVNTWNTTEDATSVVDYPDDAGVFLQWVEGWIGGVLTSSPLFNAIPGSWQAQLLATAGMAILPPTFGEEQSPTIKTHLTNALHFRHGTQNMRVRDTEFQIPLPPHPSDPTRPDFSVVRRAWWDVIKLVYDPRESADGSSPMRLTLELRIMGGSDVLMAPQYGNRWGTASIEVLTVPDTVTDGEWTAFMQRVADAWMGYAYTDAQGETLHVRPHWAKEWEGLKFRGRDAREYLKEVAYKEQLVSFRSALGRIGEGQGWGLQDLQKRFSNELWDKMVFEE